MKPSKLTLKEIIESSDGGIRKFYFEGDVYQKEKEATNYVTQKAMQRTDSESLLEKVRFVAGEMVNNARSHGNDMNPTKDVLIAHCWKENDFYFAVIDHGAGFDMDTPPEHGDGFTSGIGIRESKKAADLVYNFGDHVAYVCFRFPAKEEEQRPLLRRLKNFLFRN